MILRILELNFYVRKFLSKRTICRFILNSMNYQETSVSYCPDLSFNLLLRRPLTRQEECARGLSHPYSQMVDKKTRG